MFHHSNTNTAWKQTFRKGYSEEILQKTRTKKYFFTLQFIEWKLVHQNKIIKCQLLKNLFLSLMKELYYGPFIFYQVGGAWKENGFKGGSKEKIMGCKGGSPKKSFKFCSDGICNNGNSLPECQKPAFLTFRKFKFSQGSMPLDPLLYYEPKGNSIPLKCKKHKSIPNRTFH